MQELNDFNALVRINAAAASARDFLLQDECQGRGIVICAGGFRYFICAWVCIRMLRRLGCNLPIELWYLGEAEMNEAMHQMIEPFGVRCRDGYSVREAHPVRILNGWELKPFAILHSDFREVLLLDADNVAVVDPTFLFDTPEYLSCGAVFWPDYGHLEPVRAIWRLTGIDFRDEPEFESGQILIDKAKCSDALALTLWMNEHSDFWYQHIHGDKETFHLAWKKLGKPYAMPRRGIDSLEGTMCQHDFSGRRIFQHRNMRKWMLQDNPRIRGFIFEDECVGFIEELKPYVYELADSLARDLVFAEVLCGARVDYNRVGHDRRNMVFEADGTIGEGSARMERWWTVYHLSGQTVLEIIGESGLTAHLVQEDTNPIKFRGTWLIHEKMPVEIMISPNTSHEQIIATSNLELDSEDSELDWQLRDAIVDYHRIGHDRRPMCLLRDGTIGVGQAGMERRWAVRMEKNTFHLEILGDDGLTARLTRDPTDEILWRGHWLIHERMPVEIRIKLPAPTATDSQSSSVPTTKNFVVTVNIGDFMHCNSKASIQAAASRWNAGYFAITSSPSTIEAPNLAKFWIFDAVPNADRIFFVDADVIIRHDCPNPFESLPANKLCAVRDGSPRFNNWNDLREEQKNHIAKMQNEFGLKVDPDEYFNSGVMMTARSHHANILKAVQKVANANILDQPYWNIIGKHCGLHLMDEAWNYIQPTCFPAMSTWIYHFAGHRPFRDTWLPRTNWRL